MIARLNRNLYSQQKKLRKVSFAIALVFTSSFIIAQNPEPVFRRYTVDDGLPSSAINHTFQDSKGYMWFATANGVSRFDGYKFENFDLQSGLVDNDVFEIYEDYKHRVWFIPLSGKLSYMENGRIVSYKHNSKIREHLPSSIEPIKCSFYVDSLDYIHLSLKRFGSISISPEGAYKRFKRKDKETAVVAEELPNGKILASYTNAPNSKYIAFHGLHQDFKTSINDHIDLNGANPHHIFFLPTQDSSVICNLFQSIIIFKNGSIISRRSYNEEIVWISIDEDRNLWIAPKEGGIQCFVGCDISKSPQSRFLHNVKITSMLKDREGAHWFSSLNDGVFYCSDINLVNITRENGLADNRINAICANSNEVFIGYDIGFVDILQNGKIKHFYLTDKVNKSSVRSILFDEQSKKTWISTIDCLYWIQDNQVHSLTKKQAPCSVFPRKLAKSRLGGYWIGAKSGLAKFDGKKVVYESYTKNDFTGCIYDLVEDYDGVVWFCTINGLWKYSGGKFQHLGSENPMLAHTSYNLFQNPMDSSLWIGTNGAGIIVKGKRKIYQIAKDDGLISNSVQQLYYSNSNVWVATRQGLSRIDLKNGNFSIQNYTTANGLPTNDVSSVCEYNGKVYVGTSKGLTVFDKEKATDAKTPPSIIITNFMVNNKQVNISTKCIELNYKQNAFNFDFVGFVFRKAGNVKYRYRMLGVNTSWVQTQAPNCQYNGLSSGHYTFEVEAQSYNGIWSTIPANISFTILPPFWKRTWFLLTGTFLFSFFIFLVFKVRVSSVKRRNDLQQNINLYKQQSLRQQMNPHFIFNTLNSIQLYILEKDTISSQKYLTKFARLMRMTLDNSLNPTIPLRDEIEALKLYLELEKLRLEDKFDYTIDLGDDETILSYMIPTLLIHPFVENAIWHGIMLKKNMSGWIKITLKDSGNIINCTVEDNGVGRKQAYEIKQQRNKYYKSRGSQITQQRIDLLSLMYKEKFNIHFEDLLDNHGESLGTKIYISIPKEINVNIQG